MNTLFLINIPNAYVMVAHLRRFWRAFCTNDGEEKIKKRSAPSLLCIVQNHGDVCLDFHEGLRACESVYDGWICSVRHAFSAQVHSELCLTSHSNFVHFLFCIRLLPGQMAVKLFLFLFLFRFVFHLFMHVNSFQNCSVIHSYLQMIKTPTHIAYIAHTSHIVSNVMLFINTLLKSH